MDVKYVTDFNQINSSELELVLVILFWLSYVWYYSVFLFMYTHMAFCPWVFMDILVVYIFA